MRRFTLLAAVFGLAAAALADDTAATRPGTWAFKPGQTFVYEAHTEFSYVGDSKYVYVCGQPQYTESKTTQTETLTLTGQVKAVGDDGAARIEFTVSAISVEAKDWTGVSAAWSSKGKDLPQEGYLRWASMAGHKFDAIIATDGAIRELKDPDWPTDATKSADRPKMEVKASKDHRDPTAKKTWLELIFVTAPRQQAWNYEFHFPIPEKMDLTPDGRERLDSELCPRVKFDTMEHPANPADAMPKERHKRGEAWWSPRNAATWRVELKGLDEAKLYKPGLMGSVVWTVQLKEKSMHELTPSSPADTDSGSAHSK